MLSFIITYMDTCISNLYFFIWTWNIFWGDLIQPEQLKEVFLVMWICLQHVSSFCFSGNIFISLLYLKNSFGGYKILTWQFFFFLATLNMSFHFILYCIISDNKSTINLIRVPMCLMSYFSLTAFKNFYFHCLSIFYFLYIAMDLVFTLLELCWVSCMH